MARTREVFVRLLYELGTDSDTHPATLTVEDKRSGKQVLAVRMTAEDVVDMLASRSTVTGQAYATRAKR